MLSSDIYVLNQLRQTQEQETDLLRPRESHLPSFIFREGTPLAPSPLIAERGLESWRNETPRLYEAPSRRKKHALKRRSQAVTTGFRNTSTLTYAEVDP